MVRIQPSALKAAVRLPWTARRIGFILFYGFFGYTVIRLLNDVISETRFWLRPIETNLTEIIGCLLINFVFEWVINSFLFQLQQENKNLLNPSASLRQFLSLAVYLEIVVIVFIFPLAALTDDGLQWYDVVILSFAPVSLWLFYFSVQQSQFLQRKSYEQLLLLEKINKDKLETELQYLKAQFHPHFLFNALNTIYFQVDEANEEARFTIEKLSELLRYQLYDQENTVPLEQEFKHLQNFIELQKTRTSEQLTIAIQWPTAIYTQRIFPLLLLPLVENAFKYLGGDLIITLEASLKENTLNFTISNSIPVIAHQHKNGGIGLVNLQKRLTLLYPNKHLLSLEKGPKSYIAHLQIDLA